MRLAGHSHNHSFVDFHCTHYYLPKYFITLKIFLSYKQNETIFDVSLSLHIEMCMDTLHTAMYT